MKRMLLAALWCSLASAVDMIDPEEGMLDMSHYLQENQLGF
ncbi:hypothetical protein ACNHGO_001758 [Salmonella enterica subsp. enterica serovar Newport]